MKQQQRQKQHNLDFLVGKEVKVAGRLWKVKKRVRARGKPFYYLYCTTDNIYGSSLYQVGNYLVFDLRFGDSKVPNKKYYLWDLTTNSIMELAEALSLQEAKQRAKNIDRQFQKVLKSQ